MSIPSSEVRASVSRAIEATAEHVYDAWITPVLIEQWLFKSDSNRLTARADPRPGGAYSIVEHSGGRVITHDGIYAVTQRPVRLQFSLVVPQHFAGVAEIEVSISPRARASWVDFVARGAGPGDAQQIWEKMLDQLAALVETV